MSDAYITRADLLAALTNTHEKTVDGGHFIPGKVLIRELTARQRLLAQQAATADNPDEPDNGLYQAMLIQMCVVDPESGVPDAAGRIDPRTRTPLFTVADVQSLMEARYGAVSALVEEITALAALGPLAMFSGSETADGSKRGKRKSGAGTEEEPAGAADEGTGNNGE